jgi:hypothetical protein
MTDRTKALKELLAKVESNNVWFDAFAKAFINNDPKDTECININCWAFGAYHGSLNAARALHDTVLPGWTYCDHLRRGMRYTVYVGKSIEYATFDGVSGDPARAWLIAILKALISEANDD